jgi:hypothetical protein
MAAKPGGKPLGLSTGAVGRIRPSQVMVIMAVKRPGVKSGLAPGAGVSWEVGRGPMRRRPIGRVT